MDSLNREPAIAKHVRYLYVNPYFNAQCGDLRWDQSWNRSLLQKGLFNTFLKSLGKFPLSGTFNKGHAINEMLQALVAAVKHMSNVTELTIDWWQHPAARHFEPFLPIAWEACRAAVETLTLGGTLEGVKQLVLHLDMMTAPPALKLQELRLNFAQVCGQFGPNKTDAFVLQHTIAPFINSLAPQLRGISISSRSVQLDLSPLFADLVDSFPLLCHFSIHVPFRAAFLSDYVCLTHFLLRHSKTIRTASLDFTPISTPSPVYMQKDDPLARWLKEVISDNDAILPHLRSLVLYPTHLSAGFAALQSLVERSVSTLTTLAIRRYRLSYDDLTALLGIFSRRATDTRLVCLCIETHRLDPPLLDMLAANLPGLRELSLRLPNITCVSLSFLIRPTLLK